VGNHVCSEEERWPGSDSTVNRHAPGGWRYLSTNNWNYNRDIAPFDRNVVYAGNVI